MIILDIQPIMKSEIPIVTIITFLIFSSLLLRKIYITKYYAAGARCMVIVFVITIAATMVEMTVNKHPTNKYRYEVVFTDDKPEDTLDVYDIVGQRGKIYYLEDKD